MCLEHVNKTLNIENKVNSKVTLTIWINIDNEKFY